jgi:phage gp46-like protein
MTDVRLFHDADGGEITFTNGRVELADGLETIAYTSLFGGNERDGGGKATEHLEWWGNKGETDEAQKCRSETQHLLASIPAISSNLRRIEDAARRDLAWMVTRGIATAVAPVASMPALNTISLVVDITVDGTVYTFDFTERWSSQSA